MLQKIDDYWLVLGLCTAGYYVILIVKYFLLNLLILFSNEKLHDVMMEGLVRSPASYFDITPSGRLSNNFSNDLGILDNMVAFIITDCLEGPIISIVMLVNIFQINLYFLIPGGIYIVFLFAFFIYCKKTNVAAKQLDLKSKSPVYNMVSEMASGLIQIRIFKRRP